MKQIKLSSLFGLCILLLSFSQDDPKSALDARLNGLKQECKEMIKPARYEGSRTTYYTLRKKPQQKSVELFLLLDNEYVFGVGCMEATADLTIRFYDSPDASKRTLILEEKGASGKNLLFSTKTLNAAYHKKVPEAERLKNVFIEYEIGPGKEKLEGIVLVIGNK